MTQSYLQSRKVTPGSCVGTMGKRGQGPSWSHRSGLEEGVETTQVRDVDTSKKGRGSKF